MKKQSPNQRSYFGPKQMIHGLGLLSLLIAIGSISAGLSAQEATEAAQQAQAVQDALEKGNFITQGGLMMIPLLLASIVGFAYVVERLSSVRPERLIPENFLTDLAVKVKSNTISDAKQFCKNAPHPCARIARVMLTLRGNTQQTIQAAMQDELDRCHADANIRTRVLGVISGVAPLLGLMGTVLGMIKAFETVAQEKSLGNATVLAGGISEALVTTATGLGIAIPCYLFYHYFRAQTDKHFRHIETSLLDFLSQYRYQLCVENVDEDAITKIKS